MLRLNLDPDDPLPIHRQISEQICLAIANGSLAAGERLPTQEEFLARWGVHIETVIRAMRTLEQEGLIESKRRLGRFVTVKRSAISETKRAKLLDSQTQAYLAALAPLQVDLNEVLKSIRDNWKGGTSK